MNAQGNRLLLIGLLCVEEPLSLDVHSDLRLALGENVAWTNTPRRWLRLTTSGDNIRSQTCMQVALCANMCMCACVPVCMHVCACICTCMHLGVCKCMCVHTRNHACTCALVCWQVFYFPSLSFIQSRLFFFLKDVFICRIISYSHGRIHFRLPMPLYNGKCLLCSLKKYSISQDETAHILRTQYNTVQ